MRWTIKDVAEYVKNGKAPRILLAILRSCQRIFSFEEERKNRLARFPKVVEAYKAGMPIEKMVEKFGCSQHTIYRYVHMTGGPQRRIDSAKVQSAILARYAEGRPIAAIAAEFGCSQSYVSAIASSHGKQRRKFKKRGA